MMVIEGFLLAMAVLWPLYLWRIRARYTYACPKCGRRYPRHTDAYTFECKGCGHTFPYVDACP
jgi:tRNA(Ile2) C34 agmatinyltransferase TiaS